MGGVTVTADRPFCHAFRDAVFQLLYQPLSLSMEVRGSRIGSPYLMLANCWGLAWGMALQIWGQECLSPRHRDAAHHCFM